MNSENGCAQATCVGAASSVAISAHVLYNFEFKTNDSVGYTVSV